MQNTEQTYEDLMKHCQRHFLHKNYEQVLFYGRRLLQNNPYDCPAQYIMASAYMHLDRFAQAEEYIEQIKKQDAEYIGAYMVEAYIYKKKKQFVTEFKLLQWIIKEIERLQKIEPEIWKASLAEAWSLLASVAVVLGMPKLAMDAFFMSGNLEENREQAIYEYSNALFVTNYIEDIGSKRIRELHHRYNEFFSSVQSYPHFLQQKKVLRIGYISPDFRLHPVAFFSKTLLQDFSSEQFSVYAYSLSLEDEVTALLKKRVIWRNLSGMKKEEAAQIIYNDQIDILVDLSGHTKNNALPVLAYKPAPVQISGIGYFNTIGLSSVKYFLSDIYCDPEDQGSDKAFSEEILRLPQSHFCYTPILPMPECPVQAPCSKNLYITFGSFNNFNKVTNSLLLLWQSVLNRVPNSQMVLKSQLFDSEEGRQYTKERLQRLGIEVHRFEFRGFTPAYLQEYADIDIALDTYPYTGGATTCEALYMGVPVITLCGKRHGARFGYSLLKNAGLSECIAFSPEEYVEKAVVLAGDQALLHGLRRQLRGILEKSDLMNEWQYIQEIENLYRNVWGKELALQAKIRIEPETVSEEIQRVWDFVHVGRFREAEALSQYLLPSVKDKADRKELWEILVGIYIEQEKKEQAESFLQKLLQNYPEYSYGLFLAARVYFLADEWEMAIKTAKKALQFAQKESAAVLSRIYNILGASYKNIGECAQSVIFYKKEIELAETRDEVATAYSNYLFNLHYLPRYDAAEMLAAHKKYNTVFAGIVPYSHERKERHEKIRIGYVSPDLRYHVVIFFSYAFFCHYDREKFSVFCYAKCAEDAVSHDIAEKVDTWRNISGCNAAEAAKIIYQDEIDILFDLSGHTKGSCLPVLAYKPAPVQVSGIGYFDTTGLETIDYFLADIYTDPWENDGLFTEKLLRLPQSHFCYVPPDRMPECPEMTPARKKGYITFGSFNNFTKTTDEMLSLWHRMMQMVPRSKLLLKSQVFGSASGKKHVEKRLKRLGFSLNQVEMRPETVNYLEEYAEIDIASLDTYPYPGGGTTCEALYMGVPVITLTGKRHGARFGYSLLKNVGMERCCAFSAEDYLLKAVALAKDIDTLDEIHRSLRQKMHESPLMQGRQYMQDLEKLYIRIWKAFLQDLSIDSPELKATWQSYRMAVDLKKNPGHKIQRNHSRLRVGYISSSFCHSAEFYLYYQLLAEADQMNFSIYCYNLGKVQDGYTMYCKNAVEKWQDMSQYSPQDIAKQIFFDEIDILVDISGENDETAAEVLALQPALIQISGWQAPSGDLGEGILRMEEAALELPFCYTGRSDLTVLAERSVKRNKKYIIGCFTPYAVWDDAVLQEWVELFTIRPDLEIHFFSECFSDQEMVKKAALHLAKAGYPVEKTVFQASPDDVLTAFINVDLVLTGSAVENPVLLCHALYMGIPVVALYDPNEKQQSARKVLAGAGLEELAVTNVLSQREKARALLMDEDFLNVLHQKLRDILLRSPLMDGKRYTRQMENWYQRIIKQEIID